MATLAFTTFYQYYDYPTFAYVAQSAPYPTYATNSLAFRFPQVTTGTPITFRARVYSAPAGDISLSVYVGTDDQNMYNNGTNYYVPLAAGEWKDYSFTAGQAGVATTSAAFVALSTYDSMYWYVAAPYAPHLIVPDGTSAWTNVSGTWRRGTPYTNVSGAWRQGEAWTNVNGVWKKGVS